MRLKAILTAAIAAGAALAAGAMVLGSGTAQAGQATPAGQAASKGLPRTVTLITGDRVTVDADHPDRVSIARGAGRSGVRFLTRTWRGHLQVVPTDALGLLHAGQLDPRLFDVTTLLGFGYDDRRADLPLIVTYQAGAPRAMARTAGTRDLPAVNGVAVKEPRGTANTFWSGIAGTAAGTGRQAAKPALTGRVAKVWLDGKRQPSDDISGPQIGAPQAWAAGFTGAGIKVGVVDTGIDATHPDLTGRVAAEANFTGDGDALDHVGHGTHVASTLAGTGAASAGKYKGIAPDATLYDAKVCLLNGCDESAILAGMQWAAADQHVKVVNMSLGGPDFPDTDPLEQAVENLTAQYGTLFVIAAGNSGADATVSSPASADDALAVGAVDKTDTLADFSSRGPRVGDQALKPDITAPGVDITAARGKDGVFGAPGDTYVQLPGTSMATPHVAASAAILAQQHPDWTPAQLKAGLMAAAKPNPTTGVYAQGAGRVDIGRATHQSVSTTPASVSFPFQQWPHSDDQPVTKTVSYHNYGTTAVTLNLALHTADQTGKPTPAGVFALSATTLTVPAGGDASVDVTADTRGGTVGLLGGDLTATSGDTAVQTPVAVDSEVESYNVTLAHLDRTGAPASEYDTVLVPLNGSDGLFDLFDPSGTGTLRVPKGRYLLSSLIFTGDQTNSTVTLLVQPVLNVTGDQKVTLDARAAKPVSVSIPQPDAKQLIANLGFTQQIGQSGFGAGIVSDSFATMFSAQVGPATPAPGLVGGVSGQWAKVGPDGTPKGTPYVDSVAFFDKGRMFTGFQRAVTMRDLATLQVKMAREATGATGEFLSFGALPDGTGGGGFSIDIPVDLPGSLTEYVNSDQGGQWSSDFFQETPSTDPSIPVPVLVSVAISTPTTYRPGHTYQEQWNQGPFGPVLPARPFPEAWLTRSGDTLNVLVPMFGDNAGRTGYAGVSSAKTTISRDGTQIISQDGRGGIFPVPADPGTYRVEFDYTRAAPFTLSTQGSVAWTFRSGHVSGDKPQVLPVSVVRFLPNLDQNNQASGPADVIPVAVTRQPDSSAGSTSTLTVQVSYDDGAHWVNPLFVRLGNGGVAVSKRPAGHGFVSLRASLTDTDGNTFEETTIRAYSF